ncbi:MAG: hypothetical protein PHT16_01975 [Candidatus Pacebacteria bacterium]|nr:hypothetical protein [Candidatus Paceibacterota bacterium]
MKSKRISYLTNISNGWFLEDEYLIGLLRGIGYEVKICHPLHPDYDTDAFVIRNVWPSPSEYREEWEKVKKRIVESGIPSYNPLTGKGDNAGKNYLVELYLDGYPVIPSIDMVEYLDILPEPETGLYYIKPKIGCDGSGAWKSTCPWQTGKLVDDSIIQPFLKFVSEPSFFFLDGKFLYAIDMPNRIADTDIELYKPTLKELFWAAQFVQWNNLSYGIQRIDAVRTKSGELLLTEVEDIEEFLYLFNLPQKKREEIANALLRSIIKNCCL